jgi:hypothetical protein
MNSFWQKHNLKFFEGTVGVDTFKKGHNISPIHMSMCPIEKRKNMA